MKVLITGATGFLGKYLIEECLSLGYEVLALGRNEAIGKGLEREGVTFVKADLTDLNALEKVFHQGIDKVVHAGGLSTVWGPWEDFYHGNVLSTENIIKLCQAYQIKRLVFVSSPSIYASANHQDNLPEEAAPKENKLSYYIESKLMAEQLVTSADGLPYVIIRPRALFGIGDTSIIPRILELNDKIGVPLLKGGKHLMDLTCVENVAYAIGLMLEKEEALGQIYNITNGEPMPFKGLMEHFFEEMGNKPRFIRLPSPLLAGLASLIEFSYRLFGIKKEPRLTRYTYYLLRYSQTLSIDKARRELGYQPRLSVLEGIKQYVAHQKY